MKHHALTTCLIFSAALGAVSFAPAQAGGAINKCVDGAGRITLTDQACDAHTVSSSIAVPGSPSEENAGIHDNAPLPMRTTGMPPRNNPMALHQARWTPSASASMPVALAGDMATMKQARVQMMLQDAAPRTRLASLDR